MKKQVLKNTYYALRHGHSEKNDLDLVVSFPEKRSYHLTAKGRKQAKQAAQWLKDKNIDLIFSSDLTRTTDTAEIVGTMLGVEVIYDERLREIGFGVLNNKTHTVYRELFNNHHDMAERFQRAPKGGENWMEVTDRMMEFLKDTEDTYQDKKILIISHGDPLWLLQWGSQCVSVDKLKSIPYPETGKPMKLDIRCLGF